MKNEITMKELKDELQKLSKKKGNKMNLFVIVSGTLIFIFVLYTFFKYKYKTDEINLDDATYYDEDEFYEDYHALDYEE